MMVALVAVKGSSERIKNKNIRPFCNTNLLELKLNHLKEVSNLKKIVVSSEDDKVLNIAKKMGVDIHVRDSKYSTSHKPMSEVYSYLASEIKEEIILWVPVTNPLAGSWVYEKAIEEYNSKVHYSMEYNCLLSVYEVNDYLFFDGKPVNFRPNPWPRSQDMKGLLAMSFVANILKREDMIKWGSTVGSNPYYFCLDRITSMDIDFQEDFDFCEMVYRQRMLNG
jgi:N-acylneuraminate cytidylyltransferase